MIMKQKINEIQSYINTLKKALDNINKEDIYQFSQLLNFTKESGKKFMIFGNGGSASTASHFACDINKGVSYKQEKKFKVISLSDNIPTILAYANDINYEDIFIEQLKNFLEPGDLVIGISGSGNSKNVLKAIKFANSKGNISVGITGYNGGELKKISSYSVNANINDMQISEDIHMIIVHLMMKLLK